MHHIPREVINTDQFERELLALESDVRRADEFIRGAQDLICRYPEKGKHKDTLKNIWAWRMTEFPNHPHVVLYYTFNEYFIWMLSIKKFEEGNNNGS